MLLPLYSEGYSTKSYTRRLCPEIQPLTLFHSHKMYLVVLLGLFTNQNDSNSNKWTPYPFINLKPEKELLSGRPSPYTPYRPLQRVPPPRALYVGCTWYMKSVNSAILYHVWNSTQDSAWTSRVCALHHWEHLKLYLQWAKLLMNWVLLSSEICKCTFI